MKRSKTKKSISIALFAAAVSVFTLLVFHYPFFKYVCANVEGGRNAVMIVGGLGIIMLAANYFATYLILWLGRIAGKVILAASFILNAVTLYFINTYDVIIDDTMMGNVFNTRYSEASGYFSLAGVLYVLVLGVLPAVAVFLKKVSYGDVRHFFANICTALLIVAGIAFGNMPNWPWIDKNAPVIGSLLMPWSYTINTFRYLGQQRQHSREEILLPDAHIDGEGKKICVLVIGESARRDHFSLYGYDRETNPLMEKEENVRCFKANSCATYTTAGVKAILDYSDTDDYYEILPNYLHRAGVNVTWRTSNWGESKLNVDSILNQNTLSEMSGISKDYDEILYYGLEDEIASSKEDRIFIVLHTSTSHGPSYYTKYPESFEKFAPVYKSVEMSKCPADQLINAYDNSILYVDSILGHVVQILKKFPQWQSCLMYVSDHGESLGEGNLYMHGVPIAIAPKEQYEIPFIVWTSEKDVEYAFDGDAVLSQHNVFHSVLHFLDIESPIYNKESDIFKKGL